VNTLLPAVIASVSAALALRGLVLMRDRGPVERLMDASAREGRPGPVARLLGILSRVLGPRLISSLNERRRARLGHALDRAGRPGGLSIQEYVGRQAAIGALALLAALLLVLTGAAMAGLLLVVLGVLFSWIWLSRAGRQRQERIERDLPDFLDVLSVTVRAGLTYRVALSRVAESLGGPLGDEIVSTLRQMDLGATRREAFLSLAERNDADMLRSYVTAQLQAEELGVPLADALLDIARDMRRAAAQAARRRAQRATPRVSLIVTTVILPASIILLLTSLFLGADLQGSLFG
jgi:tight adherence protein C